MKLVFDVPAVKLPVGERVSQVLLQEVPGDACAFALVLAWAVTLRICEAGATPPATAVKVRAGELNVRPEAVEPVTFRVTVADCVPPDAVMETVPVHVVPAAKPD